MQERYCDKYFSVLGDSMSTLQGVSVPEGAAFYEGGRKWEFGIFAPQDTWWGQVIAALGGKMLVCDAFSGSTVSRDPLCEFPSYGCSDERTGSLHRGEVMPDVIMVLLGANDRGMRVAVRGERDWCFEGAYRLMISKLKANYPHAQIWCMTVPWAENGYKMTPDPYSEIIRQVAQAQNCRPIELSDTLYPSPDNLHPNNEGMKIISNRILEQV